MRNLKTSRYVLAASVALLFTVQWMAAQEITGTISGTIKDQSGAVLPAANITVTNLETGISRTAVTGTRGEYRIPALSVGNYQIQAGMAGFQTEIRKGVVLTVGREAVVDFNLKIGDVSEQVTVTGEAPIIETTSASVSGLVDSQQMRDIPLNARSFIELVPLQAGAVLSETGGQSSVFGFGKKLAVVGQRYTSNSFLLDGSDINDASGSAGSASGELAGVETVREFRVITNAYDAEYGRHTGGVISAITKSGTNQFHGSAFEFLRNSALDARSFFDRDPAHPTIRSNPAPFRRNQFGGSAGGPLIKDRTFFFGSYEGLRESLGITKTYNVPGISMRQGILPRPGQAPQIVTISPASKPFVDSYPLPNTPDRSDGTAQFISATNRPTSENFWSTKVDHRFSDNDSMFVRFNKDDSKRQNPAFNTASRTTTGSRFTTLEETHIWSPALLSRTNIAFNRTSYGDRDVERAGFVFPKTTFNDNKDAIGRIQVSGLENWGGGTLSPRQSFQNLWEFKEEGFVTKGRQSLKFGMQAEKLQLNMRGDFNGGGAWVFSGISDFLTNNVANVSFTKPGSDSFRTWNQNLWGFFLQDDVQVRPGLTMNAGLRYEFITVPEERWGRSATIRDLTAPHINTVTPDQTDIGPLFKNPSLHNLAPRVGLAWDVFGDGKTSVRTGAGIFHDQLLPIYYVVPGNRTSPFYAVSQIFQQDIVRATGAPIDFPNAYFSQQDLVIHSAGGVKPQIDGFEYHVSQPAVYKWSFDLERQLGAAFSVNAGYTGTRGTHLMRGNLQLNSSPSEFRNGRRYILFEPGVNNPNFNRFRWRINDGDSAYNGFRISVTKRFSRGFQMQSSYNFSRSTDTGSAFLGSGDFTNDRQPYRATKENALSAFDVRHAFNTNFVYDLPGKKAASTLGKVVGGWTLSGILRLNSGNPNSMVADQPRKGALQMIFADGPTVDLIPGGKLSPARPRNADQYFDVTQFAFPRDVFGDPSYQGNVGVNTLIGPGVANVDLTLIKDTHVGFLGEAGGLQFRAEMFNVFNRANFQDPAVNLFNQNGGRRSNAGQITDIRTSPRQIQFALRVTF